MEELEIGFEGNRRIKGILGKSRKKERKREETARKKTTVKTNGKGIQRIKAINGTI